METLAQFFGIISLGFLLWNVVVAIKISKVLETHGHKVFYPLLHVRIYRYANLYRKLTLEREGKVGPLFKQFHLSNYLFFGFLVLGMLTVYLG